MLRGFHPRHIGTLDFALCPRWIFLLNFLEAVFGGIYCSYCRKTHTENSEKNSVEKFGEIIPFFGAFFGTFFGEPTFASKSEKFVQNPFCKRDPLIERGVKSSLKEAHFYRELEAKKAHKP